MILYQTNNNNNDNIFFKSSANNTSCNEIISMYYETEFSQISNKIARWHKHKKDLKFLFPKEIETLHKSDIELRTQNPVTPVVLKIVTPITVRKDSAFAKICYQKK